MTNESDEFPDDLPPDDSQPENSEGPNNDGPIGDGPIGDNAFDLSVPTGNLATPDETGFRPPDPVSEDLTKKRKPASDETYSPSGWKGIDDEEVEEEPVVAFGKKEKIPEDDLDMTPMVDVTFLLLIFFMVTASFTLQKSLAQPPASSDAPSENVQDEQDEDDYVEVIIDQNNTYYVTSRGEAEIEAPSETEMRSLVKDAVDTFAPKRMVITAHVDATYDRYITACDAGQTNRLSIQTKTTDVEY